MGSRVLLETLGQHDGDVEPWSADTGVSADDGAEDSDGETNDDRSPDGSDSGNADGDGLSGPRLVGTIGTLGATAYMLVCRRRSN